jgi:protoheme IX farnesyltransferase
MKSSLMVAVETKAQTARLSPAKSLSAKALSKAADYLLLIKLRLSSLALFTAGIGYLMAVQGRVDFKHFSVTMLGTFLVIAGACALNQVLERDVDARMRRTANRPLPTMRMSVLEAAVAASGMAFVGAAVLCVYANLLSAMLALTALTLYLFAYTPLKPLSPLCNFFGSMAGALPPLIGWAAVRDGIQLGGAALFALQFLWQFPHLWSIAWVYESDYARAGFRVMPDLNKQSRQVAQKIVLFSFAMVALSLVPLAAGMVSLVGAIGSLAIGWMVVKPSVALWRNPTRETAQRLMIAAMMYLPAVMTVMVIDARVLMRYF